MDERNQTASPGPGGSNLSPSTYQVNVNRKKTRKWVEAKVQSYDGDDWGAPESEDEGDSPVAAPPPVPRPMGGPRLPSESRVAGAGRSVSGYVPAQVPTAQPPIEESVPAVSNPKDSAVPPQPEPVQTEPVLPATTSAELQNQEDIRSPTQVPESSGEFEADRKRMSVSPQLPNVARMSGFGVDFFSPGAEPSAIHEPTVQEEREPTPGAKEPFSAPTSTFAPPPAEPSAPEPVKSEAPQPAQTVPRRPSLPGQYVTEDPTHEMIPTPLSPPVQVNEPQSSPDSDDAPKLAEPSAGVSGAESKQLRASADAKSLPPLRTPSPHEPRTVPPPAEEHAAAAEALMDSPEKSQPEITPTEPLQPKSATNYTPSDYEAQPLSRQFTHDTTTSSPVKESDVLSEEIMRTLTPGGLTSPSENPDNKRKSSLQSGRESTYTLSGYDDYWADSADKAKTDAPGRLEDVPEVPPVPASVGGPAQPAKAPEPAVISSEPIVSPSSESQASLRRRFSWEAAEESQAAEPAVPVAAAAAAHQPAAPAPAPAPETSKTAEPERTSTPGASSPASPTINIVSETPSISHQVSQASSKPPTQPTPEPPSPVSELSDRDATPLAQPMVSPDNDTGLPMASPLSSNPVSGPNEALTPKIASPTPMSPGKSIVTFREIMDMPTPKDRIAKYKETQSLFASQDSGLENWITTMKDEYPEHARANGSFSGTPAPVPPPSAGGAPGPGQQAPSDQPYYQQYLQANANAPNSSNSGSARSRIVGYSSHAQAAAGSAFGDGGKQIGTKGKEFMHSAGKMGKGLFSKGKSKLQQAREAREARGEKGETSPPPTDRKPQGPERPDRRMSWALSLGQKSRENGPAPPGANAEHSSGHVHGHERHDSSLSGLSAEPPRLAEPARMSPLIPDPSPTKGGQGVFWQDGDGDTKSKSRDVDREPATGSADDQGAQAVQQQNQGPVQAQQQDQRIEPPPNEDSDWVVVPRQSADHHDTVATGQNAHHPQLPAGKAVVAEDSGVAMASQSPDTRPDAQRHPSFKGLPPIRRNSSFGLSAFDTQEAGRVSPVEDDDVRAQHGNDASAVQHRNVNAYPNGTFPPHDNATNRSAGVDSNATLIGQDSTARTGRSSMSLSKEPMRFYQPPQQQEQQQQQLHQLQVDTQSQSPQQHGLPGQPNVANPIQRTPPPGWQVEESHLAAPLHVARRRAGTDGSQQQPAYGLDKETGGTLSPTSPGAGTGSGTNFGSYQAPLPQPPRQRTSDVPPSSARRYPDLFRPASQTPPQRARAGSGGQPMASYQQYQPRAYQEGQPQVDKAEEAGYVVSEEHDEGTKRKASDIFKGFGGRFKKHNSEEARDPVSQPGYGFERADTMNSMTSTGQTSQKKKRASFIPGALRSRSSMDVVPPPQIHDPSRPMTQESASGPERSQTPQSEKRRSLLGGKLSAAQQKFLPGGLPGSHKGSSTSNLANDTSSVGGADSVNGSMGPPKKRFSGFTDKAATFAGRFRNSGDNQQHSDMPQDPAATQSQSSLPPPPPPKTRGRSASAASAGSFGMAPPLAPAADSDERRGRRGSFQGMVSNIMGRSSSKTRQPEGQQQQTPREFVHYHPGAASQQQYGGQGPYPPVQGQAFPPGQYNQPPPQVEQGRGSLDAGQRASRHLSGQFMQPTRPSPLAQESSAATPQSPVQHEEQRVVSPPPPSNHSEHANSPIATSEGRRSPMPFTVARKPTKSERERNAAGAAAAVPQPEAESQESVSSPTHSTATERPAQSVHSAHPVEQRVEELSRSSTPRNDPPLSPVKRLPTPHASALFSSMAASEEPRPPLPAAPQQQEPTRTTAFPHQEIRSAGPSGHVRTESAASSRATQSATGFAPSRELTPVQPVGPQGPPSATPSADRFSGSQHGSPAQSRQAEGRFSPPQPPQNAQFQGSQQLPSQPMQQRPCSTSPAPQGFQQQVIRPAPPQGHPQGQQHPQGFRQGFPQQQSPHLQGLHQGLGPQSFQQNGQPQGQPTQPQSEGHKSGLKGLKNRFSTQIAKIQAQPQAHDRPQDYQQVQQIQQGQQPQKESWKDRLANMAPANQAKHQEPQQQQQQAHGQSQHGNWKDRLANMAPSSQVKQQHPQPQHYAQQQPQQQALQPGQPQQYIQADGPAPGAQGPPPQPGQQPPIPPQPRSSQVLQGPQAPQAPHWQAQRPEQVPEHTPQGPSVQPSQPSPAKPEKSSWRSRVSGLGAIGSQSSQESQDRPEKGDKPSAGDKLFGALKRVSKPAEQRPTPPPKNSQQPQGQWRPSPVQQVPFGAPPPQQPQSRPHPFNPNDAFSQYAQQAQTRPQQQQQIPPGQGFQQYPPHQQPQQWQGPQHSGRPGHPQQQWSYGQQMAMHHQHPGVPPPEPQYDQVPIPKGYGQVQGEYNAGQRMPQGQPMYHEQAHPPRVQQYYQGQYPPQQQQHMQMQQPGYHQGGHMSPASHQPGQHVPSGDLQNPQQHQSHQYVPGRESPASPPEQGGFNLPIQGNITPGEPNPPQMHVLGTQQQQYEQTAQQAGLQRPPAVRGDTITSDTGRSIESGVMGGTGQRVLPPGAPQHGHHLQPQPSTTSMNGQGQDLSGSASQVSLNAAGAQPKEVSRPSSLSPDVFVEEPKNNLNIDVEKSKQDTDSENIYDATPRLKQETTGNSQGVSDQSSKQPTPEGNNKVAPVVAAEPTVIVPVPADKSSVPPRENETSPPMELEDTADARMRTLRIGSQEEKIFYDPEGDVPKMSATSYPGQEWNPYGEPEFADWRDD